MLLDVAERSVGPISSDETPLSNTTADDAKKFLAPKEDNVAAAGNQGQDNQADNGNQSDEELVRLCGIRFFHSIALHIFSDERIVSAPSCGPPISCDD